MDSEASTEIKGCIKKGESGMSRNTPDSPLSTFLNNNLQKKEPSDYQGHLVYTKQMDQHNYTHPYLKSQEEILESEAHALSLEPTSENIQHIQSAIDLMQSGTLVRIAVFSEENIWSIKENNTDPVGTIVKFNGDTFECSHCQPYKVCHHGIAVQMIEEQERDQAWIEAQQIIEDGKYAEGDYHDFVF